MDGYRLNIKKNFASFMKIIFNFTFSYAVVSIFFFMLFLLFRWINGVPLELNNDELFINFLKINKYLFLGLSFYITLLKTIPRSREREHNRIHTFFRRKFVTLDIVDRGYYYKIITNLYLSFSFSIIIIITFLGNNFQNITQIWMIIMVLISFLFFLTPTLIDDYDSAFLSLEKYLETKQISYLESTFHDINKIVKGIIDEKTIYNLLRFISSYDSVEQVDHIDFMTDLKESLESRDIKNIFESFFTLIKLSKNDDELHISDIIIAPDYPWRTRTRFFINNNWRYIIPPSIFVVWLFNRL